jgi:succinate dehydrogenase hydrophobic anchor subunit
MLDLFSDQTSQMYLAITLVLAGLNSILAGWQIAGDYAEKFNLNQTLLVSFGTIVSIAYIAAGICIIF